MTQNRSTPLPSEDDMVDNILAVYRRATAAQRAEGAAWYPLAGDIASAIADRTDTSVKRVAVVIAALSPRNPWRWNVADAYRYLVAAASGDAMPSATTFRRNQLRAWDAASRNTKDPWVGAALKVRSFVAAITGDVNAVVVDVWAMRVATNGVRDMVGSDRDYVRVSDAYLAATAFIEHEAGDGWKMHASTVQAVTWVVAQSEGLGSRRSGQHGLTHKRDTPAFIRSLVP